MSIEEVKTLIISKNLTSREATDSGDNLTTLATIDAKGLNFGTLAPGETSKALIIALHVPKASSINNIKLGLIRDGKVPFTINTFGIASKDYLDFNFSPDDYFSGINVNDENLNNFNFLIGNRTSNMSEYVYLTVTLPINKAFGAGIIRYKWYFDYSN